jgi:hypothetical protein
MAIDEQIRPNRMMICESQPVLCLVDNRNRLQLRQLRKLNGEIRRGGGSAPYREPVTRRGALVRGDGSETLIADVGGEGVGGDGAKEGE